MTKRRSLGALFGFRVLALHPLGCPSCGKSAKLGARTVITVAGAYGARPIVGSR